MNWLENAALLGASVVYADGRAGHRVSCHWDGKALICKQI